VATIKELGISIAYDFKEGNDMGGREDIIENTFGVIPSGKTIGKVLLDSKYYSNMLQVFVMDHLQSVLTDPLPEPADNGMVRGGFTEG